MDIWPADVARHMDVSRSAYHQWEKGITRPRDIGTYERLAAFLGVRLGELGVDIREMKLAADPRAKGKLVTKEKSEAREG